MSAERFGGLRMQIAAEAARLMYEEDVKEYFRAKRMAAQPVAAPLQGRARRFRRLEFQRPAADGNAIGQLGEIAFLVPAAHKYSRSEAFIM